MIYRTIEYDFNKKGDVIYHHVKIEHDNIIKKFNSDDFIKDWYYSIKYFLHDLNGSGIMIGSSSVDHFIMDTEDYSSTYLAFQDDIPYLFYPDRKIKDWFDDKRIREGIELFVKKGTNPTWLELKEYVGDLKK